jgi:ABC-type polysaccharide/polyol phosphate transport system ATPase subunit
VSAPAIVGRDVAKLYRRFAHRNQFRTLKSALLTGSVLSDLRPDETFTALESVSFEVPRGATFAVIGENGSGKSTLLKLVAGITKPTRGSLAVEGRVSALIELGAGFHPEISGRENVAINAIMLGLTRKEVERRFDEIVDFAELRDFIDAPVKTYSSGMYMRLGFAVAIHVDPDVLLIDEVLAVGDESFTRKCLDKIAEFRRRGKTILFVTHSLGLVEKMCDDALWLRQGRTADRGDPKRVVDAYLTWVAGGEEALLRSSRRGRRSGRRPGESPPPRPRRARSAPRRAATAPAGGAAARSRSARSACSTRGAASGTSSCPGRRVTLALSVHAGRPSPTSCSGSGLFSAEGTSVYGTNTDIEGFVPRRAPATPRSGSILEGLSLVEGTYLVDLAAHRKDGTPYDYLRGLHSFRVKSRVKDVGLYRPQHRWSFAGGAEIDLPSRGASSTSATTPARERPPRRYAWTMTRADRLADLVRERRGWRAAGRVVLTNGCFDLLHPGHVALLEAARRGGGRARRGPQLRRLGPRPQGRGAAAGAGGRAGRGAPLPRGGRPRRGLRRAHAASGRRSRSCPTCWSRAPTGPRTRSWGAPRSRPPGAAGAGRARARPLDVRARRPHPRP